MFPGGRRLDCLRSFQNDQINMYRSGNSQFSCRIFPLGQSTTLCPRKPSLYRYQKALPTGKSIQKYQEDISVKKQHLPLSNYYCMTSIWSSRGSTVCICRRPENHHPQTCHHSCSHHLQIPGEKPTMGMPNRSYFSKNPDLDIIQWCTQTMHRSLHQIRKINLHSSLHTTTQSSNQ